MTTESANEKAPHTAVTAEGQSVGPAIARHSNDTTTLDRVLTNLQAEMATMNRRITELEAENKQLKRQVSEAYDWSQEVHHDTRWVG